MNAKFKKLLVLGAMALAMVVAPNKGLAATKGSTFVYQGQTVVKVWFDKGDPGDVQLEYDTGNFSQIMKGAATYEKALSKPATCCADGYVVYSFKDWISEEIPQEATKKHNWGPVEDLIIEATCEEGGVTGKVQYCTTCGTKDADGNVCEDCTKVISMTETRAKGHKPQEYIYSSSFHNVTWADGSNATKAVNGKKDLKLIYDRLEGIYDVVTECSVCGKRLGGPRTEIIPQVRHELADEYITLVELGENTIFNTNSSNKTARKQSPSVEVWLDDCAKKGTYSIVTYGIYEDDEDIIGIPEFYVSYDGGSFYGVAINTDQFEIKANTHFTKYACVDEATYSTKNLETVGGSYLTKDQNKKKLTTLVANGKVKNKSCKVPGTYDAVGICHCGVEVYRKTTDAPVSEDHQAAKNPVYENITYTCQKDGTRDEVIYCTVCDKELSRKTVKHAAVPHSSEYKLLDKKNPYYGERAQLLSKTPYTTDKATVVEARPHHEGSYDSVLVCEFGVEHDRKHITVPAVKHTCTYKFEIEWEPASAYRTGGEDYIYEGAFNKEGKYPYYYTGDGYYTTNSGEKLNMASIVAIPTCADLTEAEARELETLIEYHCDLKLVDEVKGDVCHLGSKTFSISTPAFTGTLRSTGKSVKIPALSSTQTFRWATNDYVGHNYGNGIGKLPWVQSEDGKSYVKICPVCNEVVDQSWIKPDANVEDKTEKIDISKAVIEGSTTYKGEYQPIPYTVTLDGKVLTLGVDFDVTNAKGNVYKGIGWHGLEIVGKGNYTGSAKGKLWITKGTNKVKVTVSKKTFKASALKKAAKSFEVKVTKKGGALKATSSNKKYVTVKKTDAGTYKITVKKGTPKGTYKVTFTSAANKNYEAAKKAVTVTVK